MKQRDTEAIYPATATQVAMLLHSMRAGERDAGLIQVQFQIHGPLNVKRLQRAWDRMILRHQAFRTSVHTMPGKGPLLVVKKSSRMEVVREDWRAVPADEHSARLTSFCDQDRQRGLNLSKTPAMRFAILQVTDDVHHVVWTCHHLLLDGWSASIVIRELIDAYAADAEGTTTTLTMDTATPQTYARWSKQQDRQPAEEFWRKELAGFRTPIPSPLPRKSDVKIGLSTFQSLNISLDEERTTRMQQVIAKYGLTPNALLQGIWALVLAGRTGNDDIVFGVTTSGRSAPLARMSQAVGCFANVQPVRITVTPKQSAYELIARLRDAQFERQAHEHVPLSDVQGWSEILGSQRLFESLIVFENFPWSEMVGNEGGTLQIKNFHGDITSTYPLTLVITPGPSWTIKCLYSESDFEERDVESLLNAILVTVDKVVADITSSSSLVMPELDSDVARPMPEKKNDHTHRSWLAHRYVPPRNECELELTRIWENQLAVHPIGIHDDFFELGGNSLAAVQLFAKIEERLGTMLPLSVLVERPTIEQLALTIQGKDVADHWRSLVPLQPHGAGRPLFCIHAGGLDVLCYRDLALALGTKQPVYGLQPIGFDGECEPLDRIEEIAAHYLREIKTVQSVGPYQLFGYCRLGATVAFEIAQQLTSAGEDVSLLVIVDASPPSREPDPKLHLNERASLAARRLSRLDWRYIQRGFAKRWERLNDLRMQLVGGAEYRRALIRKRIQQACLQATYHYAMTPYPGTLTYILSSDFVDNRAEQWGEIVSCLDLRVLPVQHEKMLDAKHVSHVADILKGEFEKATEDSS